MSDVLFYGGVAGFCLGILWSIWFAVDLPMISFVLLLALGVGLVWRKNRTAVFAPHVLLLSVLLCTMAIGGLRVVLAESYSTTSVVSAHVGTSLTLSGQITREPDRRDQTQHLYLYSAAVDETLLVITDRFGQYQYGDRVTVTGELLQPTSFETELGRTFNYPGYLRARGVEYLMIFADVTVTDTGGGNPFIAALLDFKHRFMDSVEATINEPAVGLGEGLLLGVKQALGDELETIFRETGIIHIVVLSGYNVSLVVIFVMYVLSFWLPFRARLVVGVGAIACFALLVGLSATVVRASLMASFILMAKYIGRTYAIMRALALAGVVMLLIDPYLLPFDVGFQLSFLATMGLILLASYMERLATFMPTFIGLREFFVATVTTQLFVMPLLLYQIGEFSVVSVIVNVLVLPMVPVAMFLTFVTGVVGLVSTSVAVPFAFITELSLEYILLVATFFASLPFAAYVVPPFPFIVVPLSYGLLGCGVWWYLTRASRQAVATIDFSDWTIETEEALRARLQSRTTQSTVTDSIFFR